MTQFLPWLRSGLATTIDGDGSAGSIWLTPSVNVVVEDGSYSVAGPQVRLRGPGDVLALNPSEIKRRVPEPGSADAETNYFCSVELFAPDLPWRYTPATPSDDRCPPWLVLVVVELGEGVTITTGTTRLAVVHVEDPVADLPDLADSWAWAHVQVTTSLDDGVPAAFDADPTAFSSRLLCPRRLRPDTAYTACLVPAFAAGRDAGLGLPASTSTDPAWTTGPVDLPIYDSWELTAGDRADFKMLAHRITPGELPPDVGFRDLDLRDMGTGMTPLPTRATFAGAMHAPRDGIEYWHDDGERQQFERDVRGAARHDAAAPAGNWWLRPARPRPCRRRTGVRRRAARHEGRARLVGRRPPVGSPVSSVPAATAFSWLVRGAQHRAAPPGRRRPG